MGGKYSIREMPDDAVIVTDEDGLVLMGTECVHGVDMLDDCEECADA